MTIFQHAQTVLQNLHSGDRAAIAGSTAACVTGFDLHSALGFIGQFVGILSGALSAAWVAYQFWRSTRPKK